MFTLIFFVVLISWVFSILGSIIKYYDFTLTVKEDELHIKRGLFEQKQLTIPFDRIQAIQIKEDLLRQPFGYASIVLESAGYGDDQQPLNSTTLYPFLEKVNVSGFIRDVIPEYHADITCEELPSVAVRRYLLRMVWVSLIIIIPTWIFVPYGIYSLLLLVPALLLGYAQYQDAEIGNTPNTIRIQWRLLSRKTAIVKKHRIQSVKTKVNPFQRRLGLADFAVTVASGSSGRTFKIRELTKESGKKFLEWVSPAYRGDVGQIEEDSPINSTS